MEVRNLEEAFDNDYIAVRRNVRFLPGNISLIRFQCLFDRKRHVF
jgi:hypothetical protein